MSTRIGLMTGKILCYNRITGDTSPIPQDQEGLDAEPYIETPVKVDYGIHTK